MQLNRSLLGAGIILLVMALPSVAQEAPHPGSATSETATDQAASIEGNTALIRIERFEVKGNTLLDPALIENLLNPFKGEGRSYTDIQRALDALEGAYRSAGYSAVHVVTPEQEVTQGTVIFRVIEAVVGKVVLSGNEHYDKENIRSALPALAEGFTPSARELSENVRLANENPTRQLDVVLAVGEEENTVDAKVNVTDSSPSKVFLTLDNTGSQSTGFYRIGAGIQYNNLFNRDHAATLNYVTAPGRMSEVSQYTASYRLPIYSTGDSLDFIAAKSDTNAGTSPIVGGTLAFSGKGHVYGLHYNHYLPRQGDYSSKVVGGLDFRAYLNNCLLNGAAICGGSTEDVTVHPVSLTYNGTLTKPAYVVDYAATIMHNLPGGSRGGTGTFNLVHFGPIAPGSSVAAGSGANADYNILRLNGSVAGALPQNWQYRVAGNAQFTHDVLVSGETLGLVGANAVRGFVERELSREKGYVLNVEFYTPELAPKLGMQNGSLRLLGFVDRASGWNNYLPGDSADRTRTSVGSVGVGLRFNYSKNLMAKLDVARVTQTVANAAASNNSLVGDRRGHISLVGSW